jgi:ubiquitin-conjugating enzyme E2 J2
MALAADRPKTNCPQILVRILSSQLNVVNKGFASYFTAIPDPTDIRIWYVRIAGLDAPYMGGEYLFCLIAPDEFPQKPPSLKFMTDNGLFVPGHKVCISVGEFHTDDKPGKHGSHGWRPSLGMYGFSLEVVNALICHQDLGGGIGIAHKSPAEKQYLASISRKYNESHYAEITAALDAFVYSNREIAPAKSLLAGRGEAIADAPASAAPASAAPAAAPAAVPAAVPASAAPAAVPVAAPAAVPTLVELAPLQAQPSGPVVTAPQLSADDELDAILAELSGV